MEKFIEFSTAVREFQYDQRYQKPTVKKYLDCANEKENLCDYIASKTCGKKDAKIVGRPIEMKKFLVGRLRIMKYCRPPWLADEKKFAFQIA